MDFGRRLGSTLFMTRPARSMRWSPACAGDGKLEPAGWSKIAPKPPEPESSDPGETDSPPPFHPNPVPSGPMTGQRGRQIMVRRAGNGATITRTAEGQVEMW